MDQIIAKCQRPGGQQMAEHPAQQAPRPQRAGPPAINRSNAPDHPQIGEKRCRHIGKCQGNQRRYQCHLPGCRLDLAPCRLVQRCHQIRLGQGEQPVRIENIATLFGQLGPPPGQIGARGVKADQRIGNGPCGGQVMGAARGIGPDAQMIEPRHAGKRRPFPECQDQRHQHSHTDQHKGNRAKQTVARQQRCHKIPRGHRHHKAEQRPKSPECKAAKARPAPPASQTRGHPHGAALGQNLGHRRGGGRVGQIIGVHDKGLGRFCHYNRSPNKNSAALSSLIWGGPSPGLSVLRAGANPIIA